MPKRTDIKTILIIGAGPIIIGQACEFDYSGAQACKALREEGYKVVLVNSNPATIMTDPETADVTYIEPITWQVVERIIEKERPDAVLPTMGGQTALNCALDLARNGVLAKFGVELIGAKEEAIDKAEDRLKFKDAMTKIGLGSARSGIAHSMEEAHQVQAEIGFPVIIRPSFTLGGTGGGIAYNTEEFVEICKRGLEASPTNELLIEESLIGWKEYEMEVVRDKADNCIIVCSIENLDPMGVHTGDSITVAPAQTLTDKEYQILRNASIAVLREIGVDTGGSNVQFAINPADGRMIVIEMNPRVSRSSALASKATGFPIAKVAAKLAVGFTLDELKNDITGGATPASFEPSIDYVVTKIPRFAFEKFPAANDRLTTQMKSVGEVMAMGRTFQESFQKALRGLETGAYGLDDRSRPGRPRARARRAGRPAHLVRGPGLPRGHVLRAGPGADPHRSVVPDPDRRHRQDREVPHRPLAQGHRCAELRELKRKGFADRRLAKLLGTDETSVRLHRHAAGVRPVFKRVDTCAAEFATSTAYLYSSYEDECEARRPATRRSWCWAVARTDRPGHRVRLLLRACGDGDARRRLRDHHGQLQPGNRVHRLRHLRSSVLRTADPRGHPRDRRRRAARRRDRPVRRPDPLKRARDLEANGVPIIGTSPDMIDAAEDRERFQKLLFELGLKQPPNRTARTPEDAVRLAAEIGYPLVVRPSYVLGGRAMEIVHEQKDLERYMREAVKVSNDSPVLLDRFLNDATEVDVDALSDGKRVMIGGIMEHIEQAGVHSGDSACSLPPFTLSAKLQDELRRQTEAMARALNVCGLMNVQFAIQGRATLPWSMCSK
jgi:carbamoyl-phosphate synthase large subunit